MFYAEWFIILRCRKKGEWFYVKTRIFSTFSRNGLLFYTDASIFMRFRTKQAIVLLFQWFSNSDYSASSVPIWRASRCYFEYRLCYFYSRGCIFITEDRALLQNDAGFYELLALSIEYCNNKMCNRITEIHTQCSLNVTILLESQVV